MGLSIDGTPVDYYWRGRIDGLRLGLVSALSYDNPAYELDRPELENLIGALVEGDFYLTSSGIPL